MLFSPLTICGKRTMESRIGIKRTDSTVSDQNWNIIGSISALKIQHCEKILNTDSRQKKFAELLTQRIEQYIFSPKTTQRMVIVNFRRIYRNFSSEISHSLLILVLFWHVLYSTPGSSGLEKEIFVSIWDQRYTFALLYHATRNDAIHKQP